MPTVAKSDLDHLIDLLNNHTPDLAAYHDAIVEELKRIFLAGFSAHAPDVPADTHLADLAESFALERAGELITDITDVTRDQVAELVASAVKDGLSPQQLAAALRDAAGFSAERAETISITESAHALGQGQRAAAETLGQDEKQWIPGQCDYCLTNAEDGWIPIDQAFSTGDDTVPAHPRCTCTVIYRTRRLHDDEDSNADKAVAPLAVARCPQCRRKLGEAVNRGARLFCPRCRAPATVG